LAAVLSPSRFPTACPTAPILMTDLLNVLPDFPTKSYTHLLPSLEKHLVTTSDLLTLDALEVAKRAHLPLLDVRRLANQVIASLHVELARNSGSATTQSNVRPAESAGKVSLNHSGKLLTRPWVYISTLDPTLDATLGGGIPPGYLTEIVGERFQSLLSQFQLLCADLILAGQARPKFSYVFSLPASFPNRMAFLVLHCTSPPKLRYQPLASSRY